MNFSIIIPVHNTATLSQCLDSITCLEYPTDTFEVIVVDNASEAWVHETVQQFIQSHPGLHIRYIREERVGSYVARNAGVAVAHGEIIAFIDADCEVEPDWLTRCRTAFVSEKTTAVIGKTIGINKNAIARFEQRMYDENILNIIAPVKGMDRLDTRNCAVQRSALNAVGLFSDVLQFSGDWELGSRLHAAGLHIVFAPDMRVRHSNPTNLVTLLHKRIKQNQGAMRALTLHPLAFQKRYFADMLRYASPSSRNKMEWLLLKATTWVYPIAALACSILPQSVGYLIYKVSTIHAIRLGRYTATFTHSYE